jgi:hypothetical protein
MNPEKLSADKILAIETPEKLFDKNNIKVQYMKLRKRWHPDKCSLPESADVFHHINVLYDKAEKLFESGMWNGNNAEVEFTILPDGKLYVFHYESVRKIDVGKMYIGKKKVLFMVEEEFEDLYKNAKRNIEGFPFKNITLEKEFKQFLPNIIFTGKTSTHSVMMMSKPEDVYSLADINEYFDGKVHPKHVAWIGSGLFNLAAMMDVSRMNHNGLTADAIFIRPTDHSVYLYGGWWYSQKAGEKVKALPSKMARVMPKEIFVDIHQKVALNLFVDKIAHACYDGSQIKSTLIESLGDKSMLGSALLMNRDIPKALISWLRANVGGRTAVDRYNDWFKVLEKCFGKRKFIKMEINSNKIYRR